MMCAISVMVSMKLSATIRKYLVLFKPPVGGRELF